MYSQSKNNYLQGEDINFEGQIITFNTHTTYIEYTF